jgi:hypothetical protein
MCSMPVPVRTALLAVAALAAVAFAAVRITNAHTTIEREPEPPHREVTPAQAAATLAKLHAPPGFRQVTCHFADREFAQKCYLNPHALVLNTKTLLRLSATWPARAGVVELLDFCGGPHHWKYGLALRHCSWHLEVGIELVGVSSNSLRVPPGRAQTQFGRKVLRSWRRGTEIELTVAGHWPGGKAPKNALRL